MFSPIDLDRWDRRAIFEEFLGLDCSFALTRELTITRFHSYVKARGLRFYPSLVWAVVTAVNQHKEFRMGLDPQGRPGFYDLVHAEYTVLDRRSHNMASLNTEYDRDFSAFYRAMSAALDRFEADGTLTASREDSVLLSCVPWFSYTGLSFQMKSSLNFLRPMFVWGRFQERQGNIILPFIDRFPKNTDLYLPGPPWGGGRLSLPSLFPVSGANPGRARSFSGLVWHDVNKVSCQTFCPILYFVVASGPLLCYK